MQTKPSTQPATTKTPFARMVERLIKYIEADNEPKHPGVIMNYDGAGIDDGGGYGRVDEDMRPDFIRRDEEGWTRLTR